MQNPTPKILGFNVIRGGLSFVTVGYGPNHLVMC